MNKKHLYLVAGFLTAAVFVGQLSESEPQVLFGFSVDIWVIRLGWMALAISSFVNYFKIKKAEKESS
ncbi:MAG: hypothetical protein ACI8QD_002825 [Cyclobacteriaceae bacterium]|jgi:hypothetical protein